MALTTGTVCITQGCGQDVSAIILKHPCRPALHTWQLPTPQRTLGWPAPLSPPHAPSPPHWGYVGVGSNQPTCPFLGQPAFCNPGCSPVPAVPPPSLDTSYPLSDTASRQPRTPSHPGGNGGAGVAWVEACSPGPSGHQCREESPGEPDTRLHPRSPASPGQPREVLPLHEASSPCQAEVGLEKLGR